MISELKLKCRARNLRLKEDDVIVAVDGKPFHGSILEFTNILSEEDKQAVGRARRVQRFLSQPFHVAEQFTGIPGVLVDIKDTIKGFNMIMDGELDHLPEAAFNLKGTIEEVIEAGEKMLAEV